MKMPPYSKLLVIVRTGHSDCAALAQGTALAEKTGAQLLLRAFDDTAAPLPADTANAWLDTTLARLISMGVKASGERIARQPAQEAMLADIEALQPDLVIKELRRESVLRRLFFTPEDWFLARRSPRPLLVVGEGSAALPTRIVAAVDIATMDGEDLLNQRIVDEARSLAEQTGAELHLAHVYEPVIDVPEDATMQVMGTSPAMIEELSKLHRERFAAIADHFGIAEPQRHLAIGRTDLALEDLCQQIGAQTLVTGSHDRSGLERFLMGHTSEVLLSHARQNVLVVKRAPFD
ncbi:MAG: universal stress protein [Hydrocarboniphaga sp.]|uniref:universal stress protein n=1 Tax=Hydrocarboniphaga sp. TaxID=2033016 RepID=UPI0026330055|nr:universal stress protein [Hydrocarboniphaga sp.]MDB5971689.1 universal stress protein [Hydrocarboniphaga sp.]